ncbi:hypothetical protein MRX96_026172 [Rhipicephalus microplus]
MTIQDTEDMADSIKRNTCIRRLSLFYTPPENSSAFIRRLSKRSRLTSGSDKASIFIGQVRDGSRGARRPTPLPCWTRFALRAKLDRAELAVLVRDRLTQIRSMDGFMRAVGVVKERVICHPAEDGRMQLDDLNEDCWSHVRRYLVTDDVRRGAVQADSA